MLASSMLSRRLISNKSSSFWLRSPNTLGLGVRRSTNNNAAKEAVTKSESSAQSKTNAKASEQIVSSADAAAGSKSFAESNPFLFQLGVATTKTSAADIMVQVVVDRKKWDEIDWKRNAVFVVFGFAYLGGFQYWLMVNKFGKWFPTRHRFANLPFAEKLKDTAGMIDAAKMVAFDVFVHLPLIYFPSYYACREIVTGTSWNPLVWVKDGCTKYWNNKDEDLLAMIKLWGPSDCIQFCMPIHMSMPFRHMVSFFWTAYVSFTRGSVKEEDGDEMSQLKRRLSVSGDSA
mmetsp:Transcript_13403/g.29111  ORF Transcript_13403/g.29111 Transcript_13403/m.29111 type:complete len:288 (-) Transcript_13403:123-986(-)|eukprot:CAMPEP_0172326524 /NCGR_PEP_ID=MMETSP1058-20130122/56789_1 /TAXON_ID=83371 /ORGANISM="Detonula confervacea, Strain CCMP 353" /LENGTH=287 /DNA_ID=CAMNT_0013043329 /DNA_START=156 /DNA_END=1019 /DNA_ORIENTATION=-